MVSAQTPASFSGRLHCGAPVDTSLLPSMAGPAPGGLRAESCAAPGPASHGGMGGPARRSHPIITCFSCSLLHPQIFCASHSAGGCHLSIPSLGSVDLAVQLGCFPGPSTMHTSSPLQLPSESAALTKPTRSLLVIAPPRWPAALREEGKPRSRRSDPPKRQVVLRGMSLFQARS